MLDSPYSRVIPGPPKPSRIVTAGFAPGRERYEVPGGGAVMVRIGAGDRVAVVNAEGGQACEIVAADDEGRTDAGFWAPGPRATRGGSRRCSRGADAAWNGLAKLRAGLLRRGINLGRARAVTMFRG
jgi:aminomethyltransferase